MRDLLKLWVVGIALFFAPQVFAESYKVLVIPDNVVTENIEVDSYIYNASAEFFSDEVVAILNSTDYINSPTVSEVRKALKNDPSAMITAKNMTSRFRSSYNVDYVALKKLANKSNSRYVLLMTSYVDAENYILRRTPWDFLNIPGASVVDPAYKLSIYAVLVDTANNRKLWSDTYYKTISVCENRIITRGTSPQTEQLQKIKDYSRYLCPQIAQNVQQNVLPPQVFAKESNQIYFDMGNIDNVFTKKYRHLGKEYDKVYVQRKADYDEFVADTKDKINNTKEQIKTKNEERKQRALERKENAKLEVKAKPVYSTYDESEEIIKTNPQSVYSDDSIGITNKVKSTAGNVKDAIFKKKTPEIKIEQQPNINNVNYYSTDMVDIDIKKKKNSLYGDTTTSRPDLRGYNN